MRPFASVIRATSPLIKVLGKHQLATGSQWKLVGGRRIPHVAAMPAKRAYVYILRCADQTFYTGIAKDVAARVAVHNARKGAKYTRARLPVVVVFQEGTMSLTRALRREHQLKQLTRSQKQALIAGRVVIKLPRRR